MGFNIFPMIAAVAKHGLESQQVKPEDFYDADGFLVCGRCGERRQMVKAFANPDEENPDRQTEILVAVDCRCERQEKARQKQREEDVKALEQLQKLRKASLMDERFADANFSNWKVTPDNQRALKLCRRYAEHFDEMIAKNQGLLFWGNVGTGKSFAAACIANYLLAQGVPVIMTSFIKLLEAIQAEMNQESEIIARMNSAKLLILDDLGTERSTDYGLEKVYNIVDSRYRKRLPVILTTNRTLGTMQSETDLRYSRIYDRILECCFPIQFTGNSWRKMQAAKRYRDMEELLFGDN